jgi:YidC/Oxa1 family membrane protein insertase
MELWNAFVQFLEEVLRFLTVWTGSFGLAIILFTILTRIFLLPLTIKQLQSSKKMQELQPLMAELRRKYGKDQQKLAQEMTKLYKEQGVNPAGGCLPLLIQLPIFLGVYQAVIGLVQEGGIPKTFLGINLGLATWQSQNPNPALFPNFEPGFQGWQYLILPILSVVLQLMVSLMAMPKIQDPQQKVMSQAMLFLPFVFGYIGFVFNQGAVLYWVIGTLLAVIQQYFVTGFGSLTKYLPFLPERKGYLTPTPVTVTSAEGTAAPSPQAEEPQRDFWAPLNKLLTTDAAATTNDRANRQAISTTKRQGSKKRR